MKVVIQNSLFIAITMLCPLTAQAEVYKWVDKDGVVHYSDTKPQDETVDVTEFLGSPIKMDDSGLVVQASEKPAIVTEPKEKDRQKAGSVKTQSKPGITLASLLADAKKYFSGWLGNKPPQASGKKLTSPPTLQASQPPSEETVVISNENMGEVLEQIAQEKQAQQDKEEALANPQVEIFTTPWCGYCKKAITYLKLNKIQYEEYDVSSNASAAMHQQMLGGGGGVPFAVINGQKIRGWNKQAYASALGL